MSNKNQSNERLDALVSASHRSKTERESGYRAKALKLYPWICGRCRREFDHTTLPELTVHHKNHDHDCNPEDGSNWELLCLYCHDNEHQRQEEAIRAGAQSSGKKEQNKSATYNPFADLKSKLNSKS